MTLDEILRSLFPSGHQVDNDHGMLAGTGLLGGATPVAVIGMAGRAPLGVDEAIRLSARIIERLESGPAQPILVLLDSDSQRMGKREELLGLNEFLAHLAKSLIFADMQGCPTVGLLYGHTAAGAFIATALATRVLLALPGADPAVMDLPSMARVTKLPIEVLEEKARATPVFAPGLANMVKAGAVLATLDAGAPLCDQVRRRLDEPSGRGDRRDELGASRGGRLKAAEIAERVHGLAIDRA